MHIIECYVISNRKVLFSSILFMYNTCMHVTSTKVLHATAKKLKSGFCTLWMFFFIVISELVA